MDPNQQAMYMIMQAATPESLESVKNIERVITNKDFLDTYFAMATDQSTELVLFITKSLKEGLSDDESQELANTLDALYKWYKKALILSLDAEARQTAEGQEVMMRHQMDLLQLMQKPLCAAMVLRVVELMGQHEGNPTAILASHRGFKDRFSTLVDGMFARFKDELTASAA